MVEGEASRPAQNSLGQRGTNSVPSSLKRGLNFFPIRFTKGGINPKNWRARMTTYYDRLAGELGKKWSELTVKEKLDIFEEGEKSD